MYFTSASLLQMENKLITSLLADDSSPLTSTPKASRVNRSSRRASDRPIHTREYNRDGQSEPYSKKDYLEEILEDKSMIYTTRYSDVRNAPRVRRPKARSNGTIDYSPQSRNVELWNRPLSLPELRPVSPDTTSHSKSSGKICFASDAELFSAINDPDSSSYFGSDDSFYVCSSRDTTSDSANENLYEMNVLDQLLNSLSESN